MTIWRKPKMSIFKMVKDTYERTGNLLAPYKKITCFEKQAEIKKIFFHKLKYKL